MDNTKKQGEVIQIQIITETHQITWNTKILTKKSKRKLKNGGTLENIWYEGALPQPLMDLMITNDRNLYFFQEKNKIYITGQKPEKYSYEVIKVQKANRHYSLPRALFNVHKDNTFINLTLDFFLYVKCRCVEIKIL